MTTYHVTLTSTAVKNLTVQANSVDDADRIARAIAKGIPAEFTPATVSVVEVNK